MQATALQRPPSGSLTHYSSLLFALYRSYLSSAVALVVPDHTRDALFQLVCDLRANTPKDRRFLARHARALMPHTLPGWLALAAALGLSFSGLVGTACAAAALSVAGLWALMGLAVAAGVFLSGVMTVLSFSLLVAALVSGSMAAGALMMYASAMAVLACLRFARQLLLGSPRTSAAPPTVQPAAAAIAEPAAPPQQEALALPVIRTKSPLKGSINSSASPAAPNSPPDSGAVSSPRRMLPAAVAAAALSDSQAAAQSAIGPAALAGSPAAVRGLRPSPFMGSEGDSKSRLSAQAGSGVSSPPPGAPKTPLADGVGDAVPAAVTATS